MVQIKANGFKFVKKAVSYGVPKSSQVKTSPSKGSSTYGMERPGHKYIKREAIGNGQYKYIYEEAKGTKTPKVEDQKMMIEEFKGVMDQTEFKRYKKYWKDSDYTGVVNAMALRGEDVTPESFVNELYNAKNALGPSVSNYLPAPTAANEYSRMFSVAGDRPSEYNDMIKQSQEKQKVKQSIDKVGDVAYLQSAGFNEQQIQEFQNDPEKLREMMNRLSRTYNNFSAT